MGGNHAGVIVTLSIVSAMFYPLLGGFVLGVDRRSAGNRVFALLCIVLCAWSTGQAMCQNAEVYEDAWLWWRISSVGWNMAGPVVFHMFDVLTGKHGRPGRWAIHALLYATGAVLFVASMTSRLFETGLVMTPFGWNSTVPSGWVPYTFDAFVALCLLPSIVGHHVYGRRSEHRAVRAQARIVVGTGIATLVLIYAIDRVPQWIGQLQMPSIAHVVMLVWIGGIGFAMARYSLFTITTEMAAQNIIDTMSDALIICARDQTVLAVNPQAERLLGLPEAELRALRVPDLFRSSSVWSSDALRTLRRGGLIQDSEVVFSRKGRSIVLSVSASLVQDRFDEPAGFVIVMRDITQRKKNEDELRFLATHDQLTGIPNRSMLLDRMAQALARARRYGHVVGVMVLDLDRFKEINDTMGHAAGDGLLRAVAERLSGLVRESDTIARLGGDEFVVLATDLPAREMAAVVARRIVKGVGQPVIIEGRKVAVTTSIGVSVFPGDGETIEDLLAHADEALYRTKEECRNDFRFYSVS
jgi:diguanylate cyclase (GGDEF)-like protein/PAS domain S-box-containing protein